MKLEQQTEQLIAQYHMLSKGERVLVALSGGADSVALLYVLRALGYAVYAFHLNHCLRGAESERDEAFVRNLCTQLAVPLTVKRADVVAYAQQRRQSVETAARALRYAELMDTADRLCIEHIATAHTANDNLETMLFHLARGTGAKGMAGIPPVRDRIIRPLWAATRAQVESYLCENAQNFVTDSSNLTLAYTRNQIRHKIIPSLCKINSGCVDAARRLSEQLRADDDALQALAEQALAGGATDKGIALAAWDTFPAVQSRMLLTLLRTCGVPMQQVSSRHIEQLQVLLAPGMDRSCHLPGGFCAYREAGCLRVLHEPYRMPMTVFDGFCAQLWDTQTVLTVERKKTSQFFRKTYDTFLADCGTIHLSTLMVRTFAPGDRLQLAQTRGARQLKRIFSDLHIVPSQRGRLAVIADQYGVIAVQNVGVDQSRIPCGGDILEFRFEGL